MDSDGDGVQDVVVLDVVRPRTAERVPVILEQSPYYDGTGRGAVLQDKKRNAAGVVTAMPLYYDNFFVPRGYAFVALDSLGSGLSTGCADDLGPRVLAVTRAALDFLTGRRTATDASRRPVKASWSTGAIGMIGKSMDGSYPLSAAAAGVPGLKAVVSISGLSDVLAFRADRAYAVQPLDENFSGRDSNTSKLETCRSSDAALTDDALAADIDPDAPFWRDRRHEPVAGRWTAATLMVSGMRDYTVPGNQALELWQGLGRAGVPRMWWLTQGGHDDPFDIDRAAWVRQVQRWFDTYLMGLDTGLAVEPPVRVQQDDLSWRTATTFPTPGARTMTLPVNSTLGGAGGASSTIGTAATVDDEPGLFDLRELAPLTESSGGLPSAVVVRGAPLARPLHVSGVVRVRVPVRPSVSRVSLYAKLVDVGPTRVPTGDPDAVGDLSVPLPGSDCWGLSTATDSACYPRRGLRLAPAVLSVLGRTRVLDVPAAQDFSTVELTLTPIDHVVAAGHRLVLVIGAQGPRETSYGSSSSKATVDVGSGGSLALPVIS